MRRQQRTPHNKLMDADRCFAAAQHRQVMRIVMFEGGVLVSHRIHVYPHNDLLNLASYQKGVIEQKLNEGIQDALALDCMACLISLGFSVEALVNFVGSKKVRDWVERRPYLDKVNQVCESVGLEFDRAQEPYARIWELKDLRDSLAHGQPIETGTTARNREELREVMQCPWDQHLNPEYIFESYHAVKEFKRLLLDHGGIALGQTLTSAFGLAV
jgi:hypothetical protein